MSTIVLAALTLLCIVAVPHAVRAQDRGTKDLAKAAQNPEPNLKSAVFVLVRKDTPDKVLEALKEFKGKVIKTSLTADKKEALREVLDRGEVGDRKAT